jgi:hypothetical protein
MKAGAIALFGLLALAPAAHASDMPAFVNATMCDVAAPIATGATVFQREIRAEVRPERRPERHAGKRAEPRPQQRQQARRARPRQEAPVEQAEVPSADPAAVLRPAVHFCVTPAGAANPVRFT